MKTKILLSSLLLISCLISSGGSILAQNLNMTNGNFSRCSGTCYDPGGTGNYGNNQVITMTICPSTPGAQVRLTFTTFQLENNWDFLDIYNGPTTGSPNIGSFTGNLPTFLIQSTDPSGCLTLVFDSDGSNVDVGFEAIMSCHFPCQQVVSELSSSLPLDSNGYIDVCLGSPITVNGNGLYPASGTNYNQSNATSTFEWDLGDNTYISGQNATHTYTAPGVYDLDLRVTDTNGCKNSNDINKLVRVSDSPSFIGTNAAQQDICLGDTNVLTGFAQDTEIEYFCNSVYPDTIFVPDGVGVAYSTTLTLDCYNPGAAITAGTQLTDVCIDFEHSYLADLELYIICPNGQRTQLYAPSIAGPTGYTVFLGEPVDNDASATFGDPYHYCFNMGATQSWVDVSEPVPPPPVGFVPTYSYVDNDGSAMNNRYYIPGGDYLPTGNYNDLIGCPINGDWTIEIWDYLSSDNGTIFNWEIYFDSTLLYTAENYTPAITDTMWQAHPSIVSTSGNQISVVPISTGSNCYTFTATDEFGCDYDTTICFNVNPAEDPTFNYSQSAYCTNEANPTPALTGIGGGTFTSTPAGLVLNANTGEIDLIASTPGTYAVTYTTPGTNCQGTETHNVSVNIAPTGVMTGDNTLCDGQTAQINIDFTGTSPWDFTYFDGATNVNISGITSSPYVINTSTSGNYSLVSVSNAACTGASSGSATVVFNELVSYSNVQAVCDGMNANYTVSFNLEDGDPATYNVTGMNGGTITNPSPGVYLFTSNPIAAGTINYSFNFSDGNACNTEVIAGTQNCNCPATATLSGGGTICPGDSLQLTVNFTGTAPYSFNASDGTNNYPYTNVATPFTFYVQNAGTYTLTDMADNTCVGSASGNATVTHNQAPTVSVPDTTICPNESINLTATPSVSGGTYSWSPGAYPNAQTINISPASTQYFYVDYDLNGCTARDSSLVTVNAGSTLTVADGAICGGGSTTLTANVSNPGGTFAWSPGSHGNVNSITVSPNTTTNYYISYTIAGCEILDTATIFVGALPTLTTDDATVCSGSEAVVNAYGSPSGGIYTWENPPAPAGSNDDSLVVANPTTTQYYPVSYNLNGCIAYDSSLITVNYKPTATVNDNAVCQGNSAPLTAIVDSTGGSYFWTPGSYPNTQSITVNPPTTTVYTLIYTLGSCSDTTTATVSVISSPTLTVNSPTICEGDSAVLTANGSPNGGTYEWSLNNQTTQSIVVSPQTTTSYNVTYTINGCVTNTSATVTVAPPFAVNAESNSPVCPGSTISFNVTPPGGTYSWTGPNGFSSQVENATIANADSSHQGNYVVTVTLNGCSASDSTTVEVVDLEADFSADPLSGCAPLEVDFSNLSNNITESTWTFGDGNNSGVLNNSNGTTHTYQDGGLYSVTLVISDGGSCFDTMTIADYIYVEDQPIASFSPSPSELKELDQTSVMNNNSIGGFTYLWTFPDNTTSTEVSPEHTFNILPGETGTVTLYVYSELGCSDTIQESVRVIEDVIYYVPNTFTPNGDPSNHYFQPVISSGIDVVSYNLQIFNRWGEKIYVSNDVTIGWDGTFNNVDCPDGVYTYKIHFIEKENDRKHEVVGHVTLYR